MQQAAMLPDHTAFAYPGELIVQQHGRSVHQAREEQTEDHITGRYG